MTKKLQELFEMPLSEDEMGLTVPIPEGAQEITTDALTNLEKIENALPQVRGLESADIEMDGLAELATNSYKDLMDLGMQVDSRFSSEIFGVAGTMLGHAITAKTAKLNKKLKMIELQIKKQKLDQDANQEDQGIDVSGTGVIVTDRNSLIEKLKNMNK
jgi:hypothetical protein